MSAEHELVKATKFKGEKYDDRQDYLAALVKVIDRLDENKFDNLSDEAADWFNGAVLALNKKRDIPDFPDEELTTADEDEDEDDADPDEGVSKDASKEAAEDEEPVSGDDLTEEDADPEEVDQAEPEGASEETRNGNTEERRGKISKQKKAPVKKGKPKQIEMPLPGPKKGQSKRTVPVDNSPIEKDRYGVIKGTKTHEVVLLYEKGATSREIAEKIGGRFYNILKQLAKEGHRVEKLEGGVFKLTHKEDRTDKPKKK